MVGLRIILVAALTVVFSTLGILRLVSVLERSFDRGSGAGSLLMILGCFTIGALAFFSARVLIRLVTREKTS
jgi:multisubunit Na+/H+ antiporter MnhG subunit